MFRHLTDNDPRPHFFHQSNLADYNPALPGTEPQPGRDPLPGHRALVGRYEAAFDRADSPLVQLASTQIAETLARQDAWTAAQGLGVARGCRTAAYTYATAALRVDRALTGHDRGDLYGGQRSGWVTLAAGAQAEPRRRPGEHGRAGRHGQARVGDKLTAATGLDRHARDRLRRQWQRCDARPAA